MTLKNQENNEQRCENKEIIDESINNNQGIINQEKETNRLVEYLKNNNPIEFYDVYP